MTPDTELQAEHAALATEAAQLRADNERLHRELLVLVGERDGARGAVERGRDRIGQVVLQAIKDLTPAADANEAGYRAAWAAGMVEAMFLAKQALDGTS